MGQTTSIQSSAASAPSAGSCPVDHRALAASSSPQPASASSGCCPIDHSSLSKSQLPPSHPPVASSSGLAQCPIQHDANTLDSRNQMPVLSQAPAAAQSTYLPTDRETSSIPRDEGGKWEYPSPQQFYNALVRKGWETPEEHVETMVNIHNFLNEMAWDEVKRWEKEACPYVAGLYIYPVASD